jgi:hypothetical protein
MCLPSVSNLHTIYEIILASENDLFREVIH